MSNIGGKSYLVRIASGRAPPLENRPYCEFWGENGVKCIQTGQTTFLGTINEFLGTISKIVKFFKFHFKHPIELFFAVETLNVAKNGNLRQFPIFSASMLWKLTKLNNLSHKEVFNILYINKVQARTWFLLAMSSTQSSDVNCNSVASKSRSFKEKTSSSRTGKAHENLSQLLLYGRYIKDISQKAFV